MVITRERREQAIHRAAGYGTAYMDVMYRWLNHWACELELAYSKARSGGFTSIGEEAESFFHQSDCLHHIGVLVRKIEMEAKS